MAGRDGQQDDRARVDPEDHDRERREAGVGHRDHLAEAQHLGQLPELRRAAGQRDRRRDERRLERAGGAGRGERGQPLARTRRARTGVAMAWKIDQGDDGGQAELGEVERALDARLAVIGEEGEAGPEEAGGEVLGRRQEEQADDARQLAQRERVPLAQEVDLDDVGLAEVERQGRERPRDRGTAPAAAAMLADDREVQADRDDAR